MVSVCARQGHTLWIFSYPKVILVLRLGIFYPQGGSSAHQTLSGNKMLFIKHFANHGVKFFPHDNSFCPHNKINANSISILQLRKLSHREIM